MTRVRRFLEQVGTIHLFCSMVNCGLEPVRESQGVVVHGGMVSAAMK